MDLASDSSLRHELQELCMDFGLLNATTTAFSSTPVSSEQPRTTEFALLSSLPPKTSSESTEEPMSSTQATRGSSVSSSAPASSSGTSSRSTASASSTESLPATTASPETTAAAAQSGQPASTSENAPATTEKSGVEPSTAAPNTTPGAAFSVDPQAAQQARAQVEDLIDEVVIADDGVLDRLCRCYKKNEGVPDQQLPVALLGCVGGISADHSRTDPYLYPYPYKSQQGGRDGDGRHHSHTGRHHDRQGDVVSQHHHHSDPVALFVVVWALLALFVVGVVYWFAKLSWRKMRLRGYERIADNAADTRQVTVRVDS